MVKQFTPKFVKFVMQIIYIFQHKNVHCIPLILIFICVWLATKLSYAAPKLLLHFDWHIHSCTGLVQSNLKRHSAFSFLKIFVEYVHNLFLYPSLDFRQAPLRELGRCYPSIKSKNIGSIT